MDHRGGFQRKSYGLNGFETFFLHLSIELLIFACNCYFFCHKVYCAVLLMTYEGKIT